MGEENSIHWREVQSDGRRQTRMGEWIEGIKPKVHNHTFDVLYIKNGVRPPCQRQPGELGWEPVA